MRSRIRRQSDPIPGPQPRPQFYRARPTPRNPVRNLARVLAAFKKAPISIGSRGVPCLHRFGASMPTVGQPTTRPDRVSPATRLQQESRTKNRGWPDHLVVGSRSDRKPHLPHPTTKTRHYCRVDRSSPSTDQCPSKRTGRACPTPSLLTFSFCLLTWSATAFELLRSAAA
jgi:hypothetical protein